jgi:hypothetical protein
VTQDNSISAARMDWAASFIARGMAVLILHDVAAGQCSCMPRRDGSGCKPKNAGKHPRMGGAWQHAGLDRIEDVAPWLTAHPFANIGILTGPPSGVWVLDVDPDNGGDVALAELERVHGPLPYTYTVRTGSGGRHYYWELPDDFTPTNGNRLPMGLDTRGAGGQVVAPGSRTLAGEYTVAVEAPPVQAPAWLLDYIRPQVVAAPAPVSAAEYDAWRALPLSGQDRLSAYARGAVGRELAALRDAMPGSRARTAVRVSRALIEFVNTPWAGLDAVTARMVYLDAAAVAAALGSGGGHDFDMAEAERIWADSVVRVGGRGREVPPELDAGGVVPHSIDWNARGAGVPPFGVTEQAGASSGLANPFAIPAPRNGAGSEREVSAAPFVLPGIDPDVARRVRQMEVDAQAKAIMKAREQSGVDAEARRRALREQMLSAAELAAMPGPQPLVEGLLNLDTTAWLIGKSGTYKSFVALDLACHVARGLPWQGRPTKAGKVVYIAAEGASGMTLRVRAWEARHGPIGENLVFLPRPVSVADEQAWGDLVAVVTEIGPVLVIGDTQARLSVGIQENDNSEMMRYVAAVDALRQPTGACVLTVHHIGRAGTDARGASSIDGAQDTELRIERTGTRALRIHQDKQKDSDDETALELSLELEGESLVVAAAVLGNPFITPERAREERRDRKRLSMRDVAIDLLRDTYAQGLGGTKAEIRRATFERMGRPDPGDERHSTWDKVWNQLVTLQVLAKVRGTASWLYIPPDDRRSLIEPVPGGGGFYAPSDRSVTESQKTAHERSEIIDIPLT